jgi:hypothetical protein
MFAGNAAMAKSYEGQCRNCYRTPIKGTAWCDSASCQDRKRQLEQGRIRDTNKRGPLNATGALEFTTVFVGRPDLSYDNTVWEFINPGKKKRLPGTASECNVELKAA